MPGSNYAIVAKARTMYGKRITPKQYDEMIHCRSVQDVANYLKTKTHFAETLQEADTSNIHRGHLENLLRRSMFDQYAKLYTYISNGEDNLFHYIIMKEEIAEILRMVLLLKAGNAKNFIIDLPGYLIRRSKINLLGISKVTRFDELVALLDGSDYAAILRRFQPAGEQAGIDYVGCEHAFYAYYYNKLFGLVQKNRNAAEARELKNLVRVQIEILNIEHIYRAISYLDIPKEKIVHSLYPYYYHLSANTLEEMMACKDQSALDQILVQTVYYQKFYGQNYPYIEDYTKRFVHQMSRRNLHFYTSAPLIFYSYYNISQIELQNIITIIEGIRYQVPENEIKAKIIQ